MLENVNKEAEINLNNQKEEIKELDNLDKKRGNFSKKIKPTEIY